jgi:hypothetical protein
VRHNAAGIRLVQGIRQGKLGKWLTLTRFGKVDDLEEVATVSDWMLLKTEKTKVCETMFTSGDLQFREGIQPDLVTVDWPETEQPPSGPTKTWTRRSGEIILITAELGFTSDVRFVGTVPRKQEKYRPLRAALRNTGWSVPLHK